MQVKLYHYSLLYITTPWWLPHSFKAFLGISHASTTEGDMFD